MLLPLDHRRCIEDLDTISVYFEIAVCGHRIQTRNSGDDSHIESQLLASPIDIPCNVVVVSGVAVSNSDHTGPLLRFVDKKIAQPPINFHVFFTGPIFSFEVNDVGAQFLEPAVVRGQMKNDTGILKRFQGREGYLFETTNSNPGHSDIE